jgi:hypothetical protein
MQFVAMSIYRADAETSSPARRFYRPLTLLSATSTTP